MSRREDAAWETLTAGRLCRWCRAWPRVERDRCQQCGHVDGGPLSRLTARAGSLSPSPACQSLVARGMSDPWALAIDQRGVFTCLPDVSKIGGFLDTARSAP